MENHRRGNRAQRATTVAFLVGVCLAAPASRLNGQQSIDQSQYLTQYTFGNLAYSWNAQTFIPGGTNISGGGFIVYNYSGDMSSTPVTINLWDGNPGLEGSTRLAGGTTIVDAPTYQWSGWADIFWAPVPVVPGQSYWLTIGDAAPPAWPQNWSIFWFTGDAYFPNGQSYLLGNIWDSCDGVEVGPWVARDYGDAAFRTYTEVTPEPATMLVFATGLVGVAGINVRRKRGPLVG